MTFSKAVSELINNPEVIAIKLISSSIYIKEYGSVLRVFYNVDGIKPDSNTFYFSPNTFIEDAWIVVYKEKPKKMTVSEIEKVLGYKIEIIGEN